MSEEETAAKLAVHEAVCAERWKQASDRLSRIEMVLGAIVLLLLVGEGSVVPRAGLIHPRWKAPPWRQAICGRGGHTNGRSNRDADDAKWERRYTIIRQDARDGLARLPYTCVQGARSRLGEWGSASRPRWVRECGAARGPALGRQRGAASYRHGPGP